jgi:hypothetical protein
LRVAIGSLILEQLRLRLRQLHLVRSRVDQDQQIALVDLLAFPKIHLLEFAIHSASHAHGVVSRDRA